MPLPTTSGRFSEKPSPDRLGYRAGTWRGSRPINRAFPRPLQHRGGGYVRRAGRIRLLQLLFNNAARRDTMKTPTHLGLIAASLTAGGVGGLIVTVVGSASHFLKGLQSIEAGDWLQSGAAIIGVGLTIGATLWLEDRRRRVEAQSEQRLLRDGLTILRSFIPSIRAEFPADMPRANRLRLTAAHYEMLRTGYDTLSYAKAGLRIRDFNLWNNLSYIEASFTAKKPVLTREEDLMRRGVASDNVLAISRGILIEFIDEIEAAIGNALTALDQAKP
jgi:hypothetical protein